METKENNKKKLRIIQTIAQHSITFLLKNPIIESAHDLYLFQALQHDEKKHVHVLQATKTSWKSIRNVPRGWGRLIYIET